MNSRIKINFFQRKPRPGYSFSIEYIFEDVRKRLNNKIEASVFICRYFNDGYYTKVLNIIQAAFRQGRINHITGEVHFLDLLMRKRNVLLTIHDCGMMQRKKGIAGRIVKWLYLSAPVRRARFITSVSQETKKEIIQYTGCTPDKIEIIPVAVNPLFQPFPGVFNEDRPNILHIGTGYNKNLPRLIEALHGVRCRLTIIGPLSDAHLAALKKNKIVYSNMYMISDNDLFQQYKECDIVSFVSIFEGFGMPIIEGNTVERVVMTSNISSMPEVAGNAACLVNPYSIVSIRQGIKKILSDKEYRNELIRLGRINKCRFDPERIARMYYTMYEKMYT